MLLCIKNAYPPRSHWSFVKRQSKNGQFFQFHFSEGPVIFNLYYTKMEPRGAPVTARLCKQNAVASREPHLCGSIILRAQRQGKYHFSGRVCAVLPIRKMRLYISGVPKTNMRNGSEGDEHGGRIRRAWISWRPPQVAGSSGVPAKP